VGNSLTATNDVPRLVETIAVAGGQPRPLTRTIAVGGFSLEDHWNRGEAQRAIAEGQWDVVVLQQGPSALLESRRLLVDYARRFDEVIRQSGGKPALYMVWPSLDRRQDFVGVSQSYRAAARAVDGSVLAVGDAWRLVLQQHRDIKLYSEDRFHPTLAGSYLAALVIYESLYDRSSVGLPAAGLSELEAKYLQQAASKISEH